VRQPAGFWGTDAPALMGSVACKHAESQPGQLGHVFAAVGSAMENKEHEYWVHVPTNELWAVALEKGTVVGACGPLDARDVVVSVLPYLPYENRDAMWIEGQRPNFRRAELLEDR
jgi:hypothetical protein